MKLCNAHLALIALVVLLGTTQMLASCGQKGDLYLNDDLLERVPPDRIGDMPPDVRDQLRQSRRAFDAAGDAELVDAVSPDPAPAADVPEAEPR
jgi:predicted small lipoprotein YifL